MRGDADSGKLRRLMEAIGRAARGPGRVYFTGGATAVSLGWRETTLDVDLKLDPEPGGVLESFPRLKEALDLNIELASPDDFLPPVPGWQERSRFIEARGPVQFFHYDFVSQALAKVARGHRKDLLDARAMVAEGLVDGARLQQALEAVLPELHRYPALDADDLRSQVDAFVASLTEPPADG